MEHGQQKTILLVEDEPFMAALEKKQLEIEGYRVVHAASGETAVEFACSPEYAIDLVLMDIDLGAGIDGTVSAKRIMEKIDVPVVFLSSHTEQAVVEKINSITSYGYVVKSPSFAVLGSWLKMTFKLFSAKTEKQQVFTEYARVFEGIQHALFLVEACADGSFRFRRTNLYHQNATGIAGADAIGKTPLELLGAAWGNGTSAHYAQCVKSRAIVKYEELLTFSSGKKNWSTTLTPILEDDRVVYIIGSSLDITRQRETERALRDNELRLDTARYNASNSLANRMLQGYPDPVLLLEAGSRTILDCNAAACDSFGWLKADLTGKSALMLYKDEQTFLDLGYRFSEAYEHAGIFQGETICKKKDGTVVDCVVTNIPLFDIDGAMVSVISMLRDISVERKRAGELSHLVNRMASMSLELANLANSAEQGREMDFSVFGFTVRQTEVACLLVAGHSSKEIGFKLSLSESTVKNHLSGMFRKLGISSRVDFMRVVSERGLRWT